jgi:hypothetical protein
VVARSGVAAQSSSATRERGGGGTAPSLGPQRLGLDCWTPALRWRPEKDKMRQCTGLVMTHYNDW